MTFSFGFKRLLHAEPDYRQLFMAGLVNGIGDRFSQVAMLALILGTTGSGLAVGLVLGLRVFPFLLLAPLGGVLTLHFSRRTIMIVTNLLRVPVALSFLFVHQADDLWILYTASTLLACAEALYAPVRKSGIPLLVRSENLHQINGLEQVMNGSVLIVGAFVGGIVSATLGPQAAFVTNALAFLIAAALIRKISFPPLRTEQVDEKVGKQPTYARKSKSKGGALMLWQFICSSVPLQILIAFELWVPVINGIDNVLISVYAIEVFKLGDWGVGLFYAALGIGLVLSSWGSRYLQLWLLPGVVACLLIEGCLLMLLSETRFASVAVLMYILLAFTSGMGNTCLDTLLMRETPEKYRGIVYGLVTACSSTMLGLSMFGAGILLEVMEPRRLGFAGGMGFACIALLFAAYAWIRRDAFKRS